MDKEGNVTFTAADKLAEVGDGKDRKEIRHRPRWPSLATPPRAPARATRWILPCNACEKCRPLIPEV